MKRSHQSTRTFPVSSKMALLLAWLLFPATGGKVNAQDQNKKPAETRKIEVGDKLPDFILHDQNGQKFDIRSVVGKKKLVIYFYPKDDTPGCTREACTFRDQYTVFDEAGAMIIGISGQSVKSHKQFGEKYHLNFTLLSDKGNKVRKRFGVPADFMGTVPGRVTYVVDLSGKVVNIFNSQTDAAAHVENALKILKAM